MDDVTMTTTTNVTDNDIIDSTDADWLTTLELRLETTRFVVQKLLMPAVLAFGIVGNVLNVAVLTRRWMKSSTNYYLTTLAVYDVVYITLSFLISYKISSGSFWIIWTKYLIARPLTNIASNTGVWLMLTFTVERYIGVCHPMKGKVWCTPQRARYIIAFVCLSAAVITLPEFFQFEVKEVVTLRNDVVSASSATGGGNSTVGGSGTGGLMSRSMVSRVVWFNVTEYERQTTAFGSTPIYSVGYGYANQALFTFIPLLLLLLFNVLLVRQVMQAAGRRKLLSASKTTTKPAEKHTDKHANRRIDKQTSDQQRITIMLIAVVVVFLLCQLPQALQNLYYVYLNATDTMTDERIVSLRITGNIFNLLVMTNCSINFILYSAFSTKFRQTFRRLFCRCLVGSSTTHLYNMTEPTATAIQPVTVIVTHPTPK